MFELRHKPQKKQPQIFNFCCISFCRHSTQASERENFLHLILTQNRTLSPRHHRMPNVFVSPLPIRCSTNSCEIFVVTSIIFHTSFLKHIAECGIIDPTVCAS